MNYKTIIITLVILVIISSSIGFISATEIRYPGDSIEVNLNELETYSNYTIKGNTSALSISVDNLLATIVIPVDYEVGSFEIIFYGYKNGKKAEKHYSSGGGSCSYNENYDWKCSAWTSCINGTQTRTCNERNNCGSIYGRPDVINDCSDTIILDVNNTLIDEPIIEDDISWWDKFVNWLKRLFSRD